VTRYNPSMNTPTKKRRRASTRFPTYQNSSARNVFTVHMIEMREHARFCRAYIYVWCVRTHRTVVPFVHEASAVAFAPRRLSSFKTATASCIVRGRLSYARRRLNCSAKEIILLSAALPDLRTAPDATSTDAQCSCNSFGTSDFIFSNKSSSESPAAEASSSAAAMATRALASSSECLASCFLFILNPVRSATVRRRTCAPDSASDAPASSSRATLAIGPNTANSSSALSTMRNDESVSSNSRRRVENARAVHSFKNIST